MRMIILASLMTAGLAAAAPAQDTDPTAQTPPRPTDTVVDPAATREPIEQQQTRNPPASPPPAPAPTPPEQTPEDGTEDPTQPSPPATGEQQPPPPGANLPPPQPTGGGTIVTGGPETFSPRPATQDYPTCSRSVTDNCRQARDPR